MSSVSSTGTSNWFTEHQALVATILGVFLAAMLSVSGYAMMVLHNVDSDNRTTQNSVMNIEKTVGNLQGMLDKLMPRDLAESTHADLYRHLSSIESDIQKLERTCVGH